MDGVSILMEPARGILHEIGAFLPRLLVAVLVIIGGWLVAKFARFAVTRALRAINFHVLTERSFLRQCQRPCLKNAPCFFRRGSPDIFKRGTRSFETLLDFTEIGGFWVCLILPEGITRASHYASLSVDASTMFARADITMSLSRPAVRPFDSGNSSSPVRSDSSPSALSK